MRSALASLSSAEDRASLQHELDGGSSFTFLLIVSTFLGRSSPPLIIVVSRASLPIPAIIIDTPRLLRVRAGASVALQAKAKLASCFAGSMARIDFNWSNPRAEMMTLPTAAAAGTANAAVLSVSPLELDARSQRQRDLQVKGASLAAGVRYTLRVSGCMRAEPSVCGFAETEIELADSPLAGSIAGGDRSVGDDDGFRLNACESSGDPDDPSAQCDASGSVRERGSNLRPFCHRS